MIELIAGAFGNLGTQVAKAAVFAGHEGIAVDKVARDIGGLDGARYIAREIDVTKPEALAGLCTGMDAAITTVGLTVSSQVVSHYDIDLRENLNLLEKSWVSHLSRNGNYATIRFGNRSLSHDMVSSLGYGQRSFKAYIQNLYPRET